MSDTRVDPPAQAGEPEMLCAFLDYYRATLMLKAEGLSDEQARTASVPPSDLNIMGLIRHMSEVERNWFQRWFVKADAPGIYGDDDDPDEDRDMHPGPHDTLADAIAVYQREIQISRDIAAAAAPDAPAAHVGESVHWAGFNPSMRWILIHMIEEYARHGGHADLIRECLDGAVGD
ncbi:MAG: DinB family protein [Ilumatobacteraceae bacterium]